MKASAKELNQSFGSLGGIIAGVFGGNVLTAALSRVWVAIRTGITNAREEMVKFGKDAENLGVPMEPLRDAIDMFERFGQSGETVVSMFGRIAAARDQAMAGNEKMTKAFQALGMSLEQLADMDDQQVFDKIAAMFAGGEGRSAAGEILGQGLKTPSIRRAVSAYGGGERIQMAGEATEEDSVRAQMYDRYKSEGFREFGNFLRFLNPMQFAERAVVRDDDVAAEMEKRRAEQEKIKRENLEALQAERVRKFEVKRATEDEDARYAADKQRERESEIREGLRMERPDVDSYARRGMLAAGALQNTDAYSTGRQQVQLAQQLLESSRRIEAHMAIEARHKDAVKQIQNRYVSEGLPQEVE
jgi:hypothetical protein